MDKLIIIDKGPPPKCMSELLELIRKRPAMYLGRNSLQDLKTWLDGFVYAIHIFGDKKFAIDIDFQSFDKFIRDHYDWDDTGGWVAKIQYYYRDEDKALDEFFRLYDEFRSTQ